MAHLFERICFVAGRTRIAYQGPLVGPGSGASLATAFFNTQALQARRESMQDRLGRAVGSECDDVLRSYSGNCIVPIIPGDWLMMCVVKEHLFLVPDDRIPIKRGIKASHSTFL